MRHPYVISICNRYPKYQNYIMPKVLNLYNLNFSYKEEFKPFQVDGYYFYPIAEKQPKERMGQPP